LNAPALGPCQTCSLISPVIDIERHEDAVSVAGLVMQALFVKDDSDAKREADRNQLAETANLNGGPAPDKSLSRRDFLRGNFLRM
ncbi:MAG: [NiFe]-hydrogenase assembly chaperone HybE, partial [Gallionella sp.]